MAGRAFEGGIYHTTTQQVTAALARLDIEEPDQLILGQEKVTIPDLIRLQARNSNEAMRGIATFLGSIRDIQITLPGTHGINEPADVQQFLQETIEKHTLISQQLSLLAYGQTQRQDAGFLPGSYESISPPLVFDVTDLETRVQDSSLKTIHTFNGEDGMVAENLETFLRSIADVQNTAKLTEEATIKVLIRKCDKSCRILVEKYVEGKLLANVTFKELVQLLETTFAVEWSPNAAKGRLYSLKSADFPTIQRLESAIIRLAKLASRDLPKTQRSDFV
uniref:hypothetical protein n=1 Tax=Litorimonas sp. TaxID=1892381 RepID=UPI003A86F090